VKLIETTKGRLPEHELARTTTFIDRPTELVNIIEYHLGDELVHRSAFVTLKEPSEIATAIVGQTG
jgi:hypothetical protein